MTKLEIKKVQYQAGKVKIWVQAHEAAKDKANYEGLTLKIQCNSDDEPRKEFKAGFESLDGVALEAMSVLESWSDCDMTVHQVNFIEKEGKLAAVQLAGVVWIMDDSKMSFKTPVAWFQAQDNKDYVLLRPKMEKIVKSLLKEIEKYLSGERAQAEMALEDQAA